MKSIEDKIKGIKLLSEKYENLINEFSDIPQIIVGKLKSLIDKYSDDFWLTKTNSVRKLKFYTIVYRVKEKDSFSEKLVRNNDYNRFSESLADLKNIDEPTLKNKIKEIDDLIGIKVLTDLNNDCSNMFKLISSSDFINDAEKEGISFNRTDLEAQPAKMKNGLNIYKIRSQYETWNFELQIKSKLESAWGDMEHAIFYKDYKITPVRGLAQQSMNHIGGLLTKIDEFLHDIRDANSNFEINSQAMLFINEFENLYSKKIAAILDGINYNFKKIASLLFNVNKIENDLLSVSEISTTHLSLNCDKYSDYILYRNNDFDLQIFESILISKADKEINAENIEAVLDKYFKLIKKSYVKFILDNNLVQEDDLANRYIELFFNACISYNCREYILNTNNVFNHIKSFNSIEEAIEVLELSSERIDQILNIYSIHCFNGSIDLYLKGKDKYNLLSDLESLKKNIQNLENVEENLTENIKSLINIFN